MKTAKLQIVNLLVSLFPLTRFYGLKRKLFEFAGLKLGKNVKIVSSANIVVLSVTIGDNSFIGHKVLISGNEINRINIGSNVDIAPNVTIVSGTHVIDMNGERSAGKGTGADVCISDGVWIGCGSIILPGVRIGQKAVIGAGSVVNKDIPAFTVAVGNPCKPIKVWNFVTKSYELIG